MSHRCCCEQVSKISKEAVFLVTKATELFLEKLVVESSKCTAADHRKTLLYKDLANAIREEHNFEVCEFCHDDFPLAKDVPPAKSGTSGGSGSRK